MTTYVDGWGNDWTAASGEAAAGLQETILNYLGMSVETGDRLKDTFGHDPAMPMAHVLKGYFGKFFATEKMEAMAVGALADVRRIASEGSVTPQENLHIDALAAWIRGDMEGAIALWERILLDHPLDVMAAKLVQYCQFYLGDGPAMRNSLARVMYAWNEEVPGYGFILGSYAFALEESGVYDRAEAAGRRAVEINPADIWAAHATAHVLEMQCRSAEGESFMAALEPHWGKIHNFKHHAQWHRALFMLDMGRYQDCLAQYDAKVWTEVAGDYLDISNGVALLWRLQEEGIDVGDRWRLLADLSAERTEEHKLAFADAHFLAALLNAGEREQAEEMRASMERYTHKKETQARVTKQVGLAIADAFLAIDAGKPGDAVDKLYPVRDRVRLLGGSHAQRDFFDRLLVRAALSAGRHAEARHVLSERLENRPNARWNWSRLANLEASESNAAAAAQAQARADALMAA
ncbi:tetratricopeptide repeat protein [Hwanghaeella sp.]|uniref:tetratricopeptide repeat protein n=1 Tax=Hwanghaeella sp. TaxID=2605943 RepID=UPI003CCBE4D8